MGKSASRGYDYNKPRKHHRNHRLERWIYRFKLMGMLLIGGGIAAFLVYLAINK
jgi:Tfp pilus assembly protein PilP